MNLDDTRARVSASVWKAIAQSRVDLSSVSTSQQAHLVDQITDQVLTAVNDMLDELVPVEPERQTVSFDDGSEDILWQGRPFLSMVESYTITTDRLRITKGMFGRNVENFELIRIQDIDFKQSMSERMMGLGDISIHGQDASNPEIILRNISDPEAVYEILRKAWLESRKRHGLQFREFM